MELIYLEAIRRIQETQESNNHTSRRIYLSYPTQIFKENIDMEFEIKNKICEEFEIPFTSVQIVGSAKLGYSYFKKKEFEWGKSDLDVAIISSRLFLMFLDYITQQTEGHTKFENYYNIDIKNSQKNSIFQGFINPKYLPLGPLKDSWINFFNELSATYCDKFKSIGAGIYATQYTFEMRQYRAIEKYLAEEGISAKI